MSSRLGALLLLLAALLLSPAAARGDAYSAVILVDSPLHYWRMNATAGTSETDLGSQGSNLTYSGGYTLNQAGHLPTIGASVSFNGSTGKAVTSVPAALTPSSTTITVEFWINPDAVAGSVIAHNRSDGTDYNWKIYLSSNKIRMHGWDNLGSDAADVGGATTVSTGVWTFGAVSMNTGTPSFKVYLNCVEDGSSGTMTDVMDGGNNAPATVAQKGYSTDDWYDGYVQEIAGFQNLSAARLCSHYNAGTNVDAVWPWTARAPRLPHFMDRGYLEKVISRGYATGLLSVRARRPPMVPLAWLPFGVLPRGNVR